MSRRLVFALYFFVFLYSTVLCVRFTLVEVKAPNGYPVHNLDTGFNYTTIQDAIDAPETVDGNTIFVEEGIYYEHLVVSKSVSLIGQNKHSTIIDGSMTGDVVKVSRDNVSITGFTIQRSGDNLLNAGVSLGNTMCCNISGNHIVDNEVGVYGSPKNTSISSNTITNNHIGIAIDPGATCNSISRNRLTANTVSIHVYYANSNSISKNNMTNNWRSITLGYSRDNRLYHNTFFNNTEPILILASGYTNIWDCGYPSGGNYWANYNRTDSNLDGIGDSWYEIDEDNVDHHPLMGMFSDFKASSEFHVHTICNSSISHFQFNSTAILFNVTGNYGSAGFCRICIPKTVMNDTFRVYVNGTEILPSPEPLPFSNTTHTYLYFSYHHSTQEVIIIPESPSIMILPLLMIATLLTVAIYRRRPKP